MRRVYLVYSFTAFLAWLILEKMDSEFKWIAFGAGAALLVFGLFLKEAAKPEEDKVEEEVDKPNKKGVDY